MGVVTVFIISLTFSGMALWVRSLYGELERYRSHTRAWSESTQRMQARLDVAEKKLKSYELF